VFVGVLCESVHDLLANLLGEGKLHILAGRGGKLDNAFVNTDGGFLDLRDGDALVHDNISAGNSDDVDWFVNAGFDGFRVGDGEDRFFDGNSGNVVASFLSDLLAVVVAI